MYLWTNVYSLCIMTIIKSDFKALFVLVGEFIF